MKQKNLDRVGQFYLDLPQVQSLKIQVQEEKKRIERCSGLGQAQPGPKHPQPNSPASPSLSLFFYFSLHDWARPRSQPTGLRCLQPTFLLSPHFTSLSHLGSTQWLAFNPNISHSSFPCSNGPVLPACSVVQLAQHQSRHGPSLQAAPFLFQEPYFPHG